MNAREGTLEIWSERMEVVLLELPSVEIEEIEVTTMGGKLVTPNYSDSFLNHLIGIANKPRIGTMIHRVAGKSTVTPLQIKIEEHQHSYFRDWMTELMENELEYRPKRNGYFEFNNHRFVLTGALPIDVSWDYGMCEGDIDCTVTLSFDSFVLEES